VAKELTSSLIRTQLPEFFVDDNSRLYVFLEKYYEYLEAQHFHFSDLVLNEYQPLLENEAGFEGIELEEATGTGSIIFDSIRDVDRDAFIVGETITGGTSAAIGLLVGTQPYGQLAGGHAAITPHHLYVKPIFGQFVKGETFTGSANRTQATLVEVQDKGVLQLGRSLEDITDIMSTTDEFLELFRKEYAPHLPRTAKTDLRKLISIADKIYRSRGSEDSYRWLWRALYDDNQLEFTYPKEYLFKVSDANWAVDKVIFVDNTTAENELYFGGKTITGTTSEASAVVQSQSTLIKAPYHLTRLVLSDIKGTFSPGEYIETSNDTDIVASGRLMSQIDNISIVSGGTSYEVGDSLTIAGGGGIDATASINSIAQGAVNEIDIADGGDGYLGTEVFTYFSESGSGAAGKATSMHQSGTARRFGAGIAITPFASIALNAADYTGLLGGHNVNTHLYSNTTTTFDMTVGSSANYGPGMFVCDTANNIVGTVISAPDGTSIIYALKDEFQPNFFNGDNGTPISAYYANGDAVSSTSTTVAGVIPVSATQYFGSLELTETAFGSLKTSIVTAVGTGYKTAPDITASQNTITAFNNDDGTLGPRSKFLNLAANVQFLFSHGKTIQGQTSGAAGEILDPFITNKSNSTFSTIRIRSVATLLVLDSTNGTADAGDNILLEDGYDPTHGSYSGTSSTMGQFRMESVPFLPDEPVLQLTTTANSTAASTNVVSVDNSMRGNNAVVTSGNLAIGSITSITIADFGIGFTSVPTVSAPSGDNNADLRATIGALATNPGEYANEDSLISGKDKIQDSYYYQDYSYVLKTNVPITDFRDNVKAFLHPAGWALFGEIAIRSTMALELDKAPSVSGLVLEPTPLNMNYLDANANLTELHINFTETQAAINPASDLIQTPEYVIKFTEFNTIDLPDTAVDYEPELEIIPTALDTTIATSSEHVIPFFPVVNPASTLIQKLEYINRIIEWDDNPIDVQNTLTNQSEIEHEPVLSAALVGGSTETLEEEIETTFNVTHAVTDNFVTSVWRPYGVASFTEANATVIRTVPTIQDFLDTFSPTATMTDLTLSHYAALLLSHVTGPTFIPQSVVGDEIFLSDIRLVAEDDNMVIDSTNGSADAGDNFLLEDGVPYGDGSYNGNESTLGNLLTENDMILFETATHDFDGLPIKFHWKEEAKYRVQSTNTTTFTVSGCNHSVYLPVGLNDFNTEAFALRDKP
tara:strand:+ start:3318 stop:6965 length:3648 start_codon:yes stop_codon:yes gene_type:complete